MADAPEQFGPLLGQSGIFGDNSQRKAALHLAVALGVHVESAVDAWTRQVDQERRSEAWKREKQDVIEVPGLTLRSERILSEFDAKPHEEKNAFLKKIANAADGKQALDEAATIASALKKRFGSSDPQDMAKNTERMDQHLVGRIEQIIKVVRLANQARQHELSRQYDLMRKLSKGLTPGL